MAAGVLGVLMNPELRAGAETSPRVIPRPLPGHPGNIFLVGEQVIVPVPAPSAQGWRVVDYDGTAVAQGQLDAGGCAHLGKLPVGYYELLTGPSATNRATLGVVEPLRAPTPRTSPISIDVAMAWFFTKERMAAPASFCTLAGINWVRDRLLWPEIEPRRGEFLPGTRYDDSARTQVAASLQVLQVSHVSAPWANPNTKRFPLDLRDIYSFYREIARRWQGQVLAIEPWNEADIKEFGGHTGDEMASLQKAAYLGLKAGNPKVIACQNVFAIHRAATLHNFAANEAWPYFDTFNAHCYEQLKDYPKAYADYRAVSAGKPIWVTETSVHVKWQGDDKLREPSAEDLRLQSERVTKTFALTLHQGVAQVFYFMLPQYSEGAVQFGLLHGDLTPRPGYLALAAVGRLLADAKPLGRVALSNDVGQAYFFRAKPDGEPADVMVAWAQQETSFSLPRAPKACFDHLGRPHPIEGKTLKIGPAPTYAVLARHSRPQLVPPPKPASLLPGKPGPVVFQALLPDDDVVVNKSAYKLAAGQDKRVPVFLYNFGDRKAAGRLLVSGLEGWQTAFPATVEIGPGERKELTLAINCGGTNTWTEADVRITGDFGAGGKPVLALRFVPGTR